MNTKDLLKSAFREAHNECAHAYHRAFIEPVMTRVIEVMDHIPANMPEEFKELHRALVYMAAAAYPYRRWATKYRGAMLPSIDCPYCRKTVEDTLEEDRSER